MALTDLQVHKCPFVPSCFQISRCKGAAAGHFPSDWMTVKGWLLSIDFGDAPCSKCRSRKFIDPHRKRPVDNFNRSIVGKRFVRLPGMAASKACGRVLLTQCLPPPAYAALCGGAIKLPRSPAEEESIAVGHGVDLPSSRLPAVSLRAEIREHQQASKMECSGDVFGPRLDSGSSP